MNYSILMFVHFLLDFPLQGEFLAKNKSFESALGVYCLCVHAAMWTMGLCFAMQYFGILAWWKPLMLFVGHFLMDGWKAFVIDNPLVDEETKVALFSTDQFFHVVQILLCLI